MPTIDLVAFIALIAFIGLLAFLLYGGIVMGHQLRLRPIRAVQALPDLVESATETGSPIQINLGSGAISGTQSLAGLSSMAILASLAPSVGVSSQLPVVTTGDGVSALLAQSVLHQAHQQYEQIERAPSPNNTQFTGATPTAYAVGAALLTEKNHPQVSLHVGQLGTEAMWLSVADERQNVRNLMATTATQAAEIPLLASENALFPEEVFALPAYLHPEPEKRQALQNSLVAQDIARWVVVGTILLGSLALTLQSFF
ncbi:MAG TPA: hypothetical protein PK299_05065 [Anaerolineales bacterium]|nr:hypothetical protein [Anaerolineales bacterium]